MSASFSWAQTVGAPGAEVRADLGASGNLANFKGVDTIGTSDYAAYPIPAGQNSYEMWLQGHFSGSFNTISDLRFWMSTNFSNPTGLVVKGNTAQTLYQLPTNASSSIAQSTLGTSDPGTRNVSTSGSLTSSLVPHPTTSDAYTDYIVLQLQTLATAAAGDTSLATFSMSYIET